MKRWLHNFAQKMQVWMYGRYGYDELSKFLTIAALVCVILSVFIPSLSTVAILLIIWSTYRTYSKNILKRQKERDFYLKIADSVKSFLNSERICGTTEKHTVIISVLRVNRICVFRRAEEK